MIKIILDDSRVTPGGHCESSAILNAMLCLCYPVTEYMAGNIEDFGTGGAAFRMLYRDFLAGCANGEDFATGAGSGDRAPLSGFAELLPIADAAVAAWHELAAGFRSLAPGIKKMGRKERQDAYAVLGALAEKVCKKENLLYTGLKRIEREM